MNLFDPLRPKLPNSRPAWLRNHIAIPHIELVPLENNNLEISLWLPLRDETFTSVRFTKIFSIPEFLEFLTQFKLDPEKTCEENFKFNGNYLDPELRTNSVRFESGFETTEVKTKMNKKQQEFKPLNLEF